jgi:S-adenosylmethionine:tRNA ribosyltransferase-isomerase
LVAKEPIDNRSNSKLLHFNANKEMLTDSKFFSLIEILNAGDLLILNNTKVIPARLYLTKETGGRIELLFNKRINDREFEVIYTSSRPPKTKTFLDFKNKYKFYINDIKKNYLILKNMSNKDIYEIFDEIGEIPLPKYIKRPASGNDIKKYQTTYAIHGGSVAAPTAGLHFTKEMIKKLLKKGVIIEYLTLHISYNTFKPIMDDDYLNHDIGYEYFEINKSIFDEIKKAKKKNKRVIAVGTTVTRVLEYCHLNNIDCTYKGETNLFIYPGHDFKSINCLITNFHLPKSSLLLLVCSFIGRERILNLYQHAINNKYRFYSYGDSMFLENI